MFPDSKLLLVPLGLVGPPTPNVHSAIEVVIDGCTGGGRGAGVHACPSSPDGTGLIRGMDCSSRDLSRRVAGGELLEDDRGQVVATREQMIGVPSTLSVAWIELVGMWLGDLPQFR